VTNHDPKPYRIPGGETRFSAAQAKVITTRLDFDPREKYETDDPQPWIAWGVRYAEPVGSAYFEPRPEYSADTA
jgi:hypothetical protein